MSTCGVCRKCCEDVGNSVKCTGCGSVFHADCIKKQDGETIKPRACKDWKCRDCKQSAVSTGSGSSTTTTSITKEFFLKVMENFKNEITNELKGVKKETLELTTTVQHLSDTVDGVVSQMNDFKKEIMSIRKENEDLRAKNNTLTSQLGKLNDRIRDLEQYSRTNNVEISGIPKTANENVKSVVKDIGSALGLEVETSSIAAAHRIPSYNKTRVPSLVVQFTERTMKEAFINKFKEARARNEHLTANKVNNTFPRDRVFVNDHLSPENKIFLSKLKQKCAEVGYSFVWCRGGKFFVRKSEGEKAIKVSTYEEIAKIK
ncbi:uncharacterized protein LOC128999593 [Macrosteles quadrilineatus]|uniref:uncharacterized protein LOC128999593 n=1 Tax=Macrosteles quadrilineatus TaxID=74068 RepID=UPI0023E28A6E|nr:uncharacterized protein LOC128999593 [Macrosteles quadrilineatus]